MSNENRVVVTGLGIVCGIGSDVPSCWNNAINGVTGIDDVKTVNTENCYAHKGAEVDIPSAELSSENYDRSSLLCIKAAGEALRDSGIDTSENSGKGIGVILGSCVGGVASIDKYYSDKFSSGNGDFSAGKGDSADIPKMPAAAIANNVAKHFNLNGETANIVNACAAGTMSISYACRLIREGKADAFVAGGSDSFSSLAFSGFHALHALDANPCSPFNHSSGITLGEGSGVLIVESYEHAVKRGAKIYCDVLSSGVSSDAYHITAPRPDGQGQMSAITRAVKSSGISFDDVDYINAHGTGTAKNDEAEFLSLHTLFDSNEHLSVSSTKSMTGHCLGAAGSIEAVFTVKAVSENVIPPTIGYSEEDLAVLAEKAGRIDFVPNTKREKPVNFAVSNSFAFGGTNASIVFSKEPVELKAEKNTEPVYITGIGKVCADDSSQEKIVDITSADYKEHGIKMAFYRKLDHFSQLQLLSGVRALENAGITLNEENENTTGCIIGTADGPIKEIADFQKCAIEGGTEKGSAFSFPNTVYNAAGGYLSIFSGIKGYSATVANSVQAGLQSICYAKSIMANGEAEIMLAAGTDENTDIERELYTELSVLGDGKPYAGGGIVLGEGSVTLVLETESSVNKRGGTVLAELAGCATAHSSTEAYTIKGSDKALANAILKACADAGITPDEIDAVCGFADGNKNVDFLERSAYLDVFGRELPIFTVKESCGEARAAASALQAAYAAEILGGRTPQVLPCYILTPALVTKSEVDVSGFRYILAASFGLGGSYSAVILKKKTV